MIKLSDLLAKTPPAGRAQAPRPQARPTPPAPESVDLPPGTSAWDTLLVLVPSLYGDQPPALRQLIRDELEQETSR